MSRLALKTVFFGYLLYNHIHGGWSAYKSTQTAPKPPLYGLYEVETFVRNGVVKRLKARAPARSA